MTVEGWAKYDTDSGSNFRYICRKDAEYQIGINVMEKLAININIPAYIYTLDGIIGLGDIFFPGLFIELIKISLSL